MRIELLEPRIAPAAVFTYTDTDGDEITVTTSKGTNDQLAAILKFTSEVEGKLRLELIDFANDPFVFAGTNLLITAEDIGPGDGLAQVGRINAVSRGAQPFIDLGTIEIAGSLAEIDAGDENSKTPGVKSLKLQSFGGAPANSIAEGNANSLIDGGIGTVVIAGDCDSKLRMPQVGSLSIGGEFRGQWLITNKVGTVSIAKIVGGGDAMGVFSAGLSDSFPGATETIAKIGRIQIGDIVGGTGSLSGQLYLVGSAPAVTIGTISGGTAGGSGAVFARAIKTLSIDGVLKGAGAISGYLEAGKIGSMTITGEDTTGLMNVGAVAKLTMGGLAAGGRLNASSLGAVKVIGSIEGSAGSLAQLHARDSIGSLDIGGSVSFATIAAGRISGFTADGRIGTVHVAGDWTASNLVASVDPVNGVWGDADDRISFGEDKVRLTATIKAIVIDGTVLGTAGGVDQFGFVAQQIGSLKVGGVNVSLTSGAGNDLTPIPVGATGDVGVREVRWT